MHAVTRCRSLLIRSGVHFGGSFIACEVSKHYAIVTSGVVFHAQEAFFDLFVRQLPVFGASGRFCMTYLTKSPACRFYMSIFSVANEWFSALQFPSVRQRRQVACPMAI